MTLTLMLPFALFIANAVSGCDSKGAIINMLLLDLIAYSRMSWIFLTFAISDALINTSGFSNSAISFSLLVWK